MSSPTASVHGIGSHHEKMLFPIFTYSALTALSDSRTVSVVVVYIDFLLVLISQYSIKIQSIFNKNIISGRRYPCAVHSPASLDVWLNAVQALIAATQIISSIVQQLYSKIPNL